MSTAPNDVELFNFTERFEEAARAVIAAALSAEPETPGGTDFLPVDNVRLLFNLGRASGLTYMRAVDTQEYCHYVGCTLTVSASVPRQSGGDTGAFIRKLNRYCSKVRAAFSMTAMPFTDENLLYYRVIKCQPAGEVVGTDEDQRADRCDMSWDIEFQILESAWPALSG